jgi:lipoprotein-anchoring transpeptidase ErfK/SrfK
LVFTPSGFGFGPGTGVTVHFNRSVSVLGVTAAGQATTTAATASTSYSFTVGPGSVLRLQQILAQLGYLPLNFSPASGVTSPTTLAGEVATINDPLPGTFTWRWPSTPTSLQALWAPGSANVMLKGALMSFEADQGPYDGYTLDGDSVDQLANASTWKALLDAAVANKRDPNPYSYVHVSETIPESLSLWSNGSVVLTSAVNTGIAEDPTPLGTYPIYLRYVVNYMSGQNPDGSSYHDLVHWINYFSGGAAVHGFVRGSYGYPQSLACVELPVATAEAAFNHLAIGDLVTVVS